MLPLNKSEVFISNAHEKFDAQTRLMGGKVRQGIAALQEALAAWTRRLGRQS